jgi:hypothetical protein
LKTTKENEPMNKELNASVLACIQTSGANEYDQRSALGMARTWLENGKPVARDVGFTHKRDDLAEALIEEIRDHDKVESVAALQAARTFINAPYLDPTMKGQGPTRAALPKPGGRE